MSRTSRRTWRRIRAVLIWLAIPILVWVWTEPVQPTARGTLSTAYAFFFLLAAPVWCGADTRGRTSCRNNSTGLLIGCHLRQHRWQKLSSLVRVDHAKRCSADSSGIQPPEPPSLGPLPHWDLPLRPGRRF
jgi:hypothetical protein